MFGERSRLWIVALLALALCTVPSATASAARDKKRARAKAAVPDAVRWQDVAVRDGVAFYARSDGLIALDVSDTGHPVELGRLGLRASVFGITLDGPRAWLAAGTHGLLLVDLADPAAPEVLARYETPGSVRQVALAGETAFLADHRQGVVVLDVSRPERPRRMATIATRGKLLALALDRSGRRLATAEGPAGVRLFDVGKPGAPDATAVLGEIRDARGVALAGDLLLVAAAREGLLVYRVDERGSVSRAGALDPGKRLAQAVWDTPAGAVVAYGDAGLEIVDLSAPASPTVRSSLRLPQSYPVYRVAVAGDTAYVACETAGFAVVDLAAPESPVVVLPGRRRMRVTFR